ncbi:hypothetical protein HYY73_06000 [Candidatus Woesearchaeota archaeon]|nr:hypothetical protein [Candidatus Woesearchaeota archaeon]
MEKALKQLDMVMRKGIELITLAKVRDRARMEKAAEVQDNLRKKIKGGKGWNGAAQVRKWRATRHGAAGT